MAYRGDRGRGARGGPPVGSGGPNIRGRGAPAARGTPNVRGRGGPPGGRGGPDTTRGRGGGPRGDFHGGGRGRGGGPRGRGGLFQPGPASIDQRLTDGSQEAVLASLQTLTVKSNEIPLRPGFGTEGASVVLRTNYFPVEVPEGAWFEYEVAISPGVGAGLRRRIFQLAELLPDWAAHGLQGFVAHDHSSKLVSAKELPQPLSMTVPFYDEDQQGPSPNGKVYTLTFTFARNTDLSGLRGHLEGELQYRDYDITPAISVLNIILAAHPNRSGGGGILVGRNRFFFRTANQPFSLGGSLEAWKGYYSSVRPTHNQLMANVNVCNMAFYTPGNLATSMIAFANSSPNATHSAFVKEVKVKMTHRRFQGTVKKLHNMNAREHKFDVDETGGKMSVEEYFKKTYQITLRYPLLALVDLGGDRLLFPPEVCEILPDQPFKGKLTEEQMAAMITVAANPPNVNAASIVGPGLTELGFKPFASQQLTAFGITIGNEMAVVPGRILSPPTIKYGQGESTVNDRASWNLRGVKFARGAKLEKWAVLIVKDGHPDDEFPSTNDPKLLATVRGFAKMCRTSGMTVDQKDPVFAMAEVPERTMTDPTRAAAIEAIKQKLASLGKPSIVLVLLSSSDKHIYAGIKHVCDCELDLATVCVQSAKFRSENGQPQYFANVALKFNTKLGGVNHALDAKSMEWLKKAPTMLVGIDVTHPGLGTVKGTPSIAAVVASYDSDFAQYPASMEVQESKKEMVTNLAKMMWERLTLYKAKNKNSLPQRILVYRDGVSEGQFNIVVNEELPAIRLACSKFDTTQKAYRPAMTIVICGKRHHTRFYPTEAADADQNGNPRSGTIVDRGVTAVYNFDFFLQAHGGLQGTTRPTHYYVVHNTIGLQADELQVLTNSVSYMFARATKAVSLVSPAYYADLACERGRCYLRKLLQGISSVAGSAGSAGEVEELVMGEARGTWGRGVGAKLRDTMFYL
ncbi:hypothetical protein GALMADRAFT_137154 [Galerina marginata CBS 339.88]|uniref:Piwi domain-containing protein n=1 Tax=Galerina marginata (strain CBS 339.88) TaxID=685588 RepID=A0A067TA97_GALM3|nr:hypothetical protein GALMADRAFT_137154 [Galerina marginata CBS 339.88]